MTVKNIEDNNKDIGERERERVTSRRLVMLERVMEVIDVDRAINWLNKILGEK